MNCLAFADGNAILSGNIEAEVVKINLLKEMVEKIGLQMFFKKTEYMTDIKNVVKHLNTEYGKINKINKFKYVEEIIQPN